MGSPWKRTHLHSVRRQPRKRLKEQNIFGVSFSSLFLTWVALWKIKYQSLQAKFYWHCKIKWKCPCEAGGEKPGETYSTLWAVRWGRCWCGQVGLTTQVIGTGTLRKAHATHSVRTRQQTAGSAHDASKCAQWAHNTEASKHSINWY